MKNPGFDLGKFVICFVTVGADSKMSIVDVLLQNKAKLSIKLKWKNALYELRVYSDKLFS